MTIRNVPVSTGVRYRSGDVRALRILLPLCLTPTHPELLGRGFGAGSIRIEHPFSTPSSGGIGAVYLAQLRNLGDRPDRLLGAATPVAERVTMQSGREGRRTARRYGSVPWLDLDPGADLRMLPGGSARLLLAGLKRALRDGDDFAFTLHFQHAGSVDTRVLVQQGR